MFNTSANSTSLDPRTEAKQRLVRVTVELLRDSPDPSNVTVRQIAARAEVGIGLINYYFGSRDSLINEAIGMLISEKVEPYLNESLASAQSPMERLVELVVASGEVAALYPQYAETALVYTLMHEKMDVPATILPLLRGILGENRPELEIRWMAYSLIVTTQAMFIHRRELQVFVGMNFNDRNDRREAIETIIKTIVK
jgi:AcrR family transcriptional regulator